jgi:ABC-type spermidine/putrescine transport system permease subunit I
VTEKSYVLPMPRKRGVVFFLLANVFAFALCAAVFAAVWYGDAISPAANVIWSFLATHSGWTVGAALSPLFAALVLGYGYARRAMARRAREKAEALAQAARSAGTQLPI